MLYETMGLMWELPRLETEPAAEMESRWSLIFDILVLKKTTGRAFSLKLLQFCAVSTYRMFELVCLTKMRRIISPIRSV